MGHLINQEQALAKISTCLKLLYISNYNSNTPYQKREILSLFFVSSSLHFGKSEVRLMKSSLNLVNHIFPLDNLTVFAYAVCQSGFAILLDQLIKDVPSLV